MQGRQEQCRAVVGVIGRGDRLTALSSFYQRRPAHTTNTQANTHHTHTVNGEERRTVTYEIVHIKPLS